MSRDRPHLRLAAAEGGEAGGAGGGGPSAPDDGIHTVADIEQLARARLPGPVWDYIAGGSGEEITLAANRAALRNLAIVPRVMVDVAGDKRYSQLLNGEATLPLAVAPMAYQRLLDPEGELAMARAALATRVPLVLSMLSSTRMEEVTAVGGVVWFQLYWLTRRSAITGLLRRAERAGCQAIVLTVGVPFLGRRLRDVRNAFILPPEVRPVNLPAEWSPTAPAPGDPIAAHLDPTLDWSELDWLRDQTDLPLVVKGILDPEDADRAVRAGADAIVVSNHGGRQLDCAVPSVVALRAVVEAVAGRCEVLVDSGIRSGIDMVKALALGAVGVLIGRPMLWGLAADGQRGATRVLDLLAADFELALGLAGCADVPSARELSTVRLDSPG